MLAHGADADFHDSRGFAQRKVLIEDEMQHLGLTGGQLREAMPQLHRLFVQFDLPRWRRTRIVAVAAELLEQPPQQRLAVAQPPELLACREPDDAEPPGFETRCPRKSKAAGCQLEVGILQHVLRPRMIAVAAVHGPAKRIGVQGFELIGSFALHSFPGE